MGDVAEAIRAKLTASLNPTRLVIEDDSHRHAGHGGARWIVNCSHYNRVFHLLAKQAESKKSK